MKRDNVVSNMKYNRKTKKMTSKSLKAALEGAGGGLRHPQRSITDA